MAQFGISKVQRIRHSRDFAHVYEGQVRAGDDNLLIFAARNDLGVTRFGLSVSRKHGNAVVRARKKRLLREAFRLKQHELPEGLDLILIPRHGDRTLEDFQLSLVRLASRLERRLARENAE